MFMNPPFLSSLEELNQRFHSCRFHIEPSWLSRTVHSDGEQEGHWVGLPIRFS